MNKIAINFDYSDNTIVFSKSNLLESLCIIALMRELEKKHEITEVYHMLLTEFSDMFYEDTNIKTN